MILQWGNGTAKNADPGDINTFLIDFPTNCLMVVACMSKDFTSTGYCWSVQTSNWTSHQFEATALTTGSAIIHPGLYYFAIGY